jgi:hypothetical protein
VECIQNVRTVFDLERKERVQAASLRHLSAPDTKIIGPCRERGMRAGRRRTRLQQLSY